MRDRPRIVRLYVDEMETYRWVVCLPNYFSGFDTWQLAMQRVDLLYRNQQEDE